METGLGRQWEAMDHDWERRRHMEWAKSHSEYLLEEDALREVEVDMLTLKNLNGSIYIMFAMCGAATCFFGEELMWEWKLKHRNALTENAMQFSVRTGIKEPLDNSEFCERRNIPKD